MARALNEASRLSRMNGAEGTKTAAVDNPVEFDSVLDSIRALRRVTLVREYPDLDGNLKRSDEEPEIHVIGYSLGGFAAQSVFMSWPFVINSCSTLLAGGALRDLAPTAFAHPEEWQTVLHSLRYELDHAMMTGKCSSDSGRVVGIRSSLFQHLHRTFYEVFQQEYKGSFQTRLAEFYSRLLFVVGGSDPIVRAQSVQESAPQGGVNLIEIARLSHFLTTGPGDTAEASQRKFWLPEVSTLIKRFSDCASEDLRTERQRTWLSPDFKVRFRKKKNQAGPLARLTDSERFAIGHDGSLSSPLFERSIEDLLVRIEGGDGYLFVMRNEIPPIFFNQRAVLRIARAMGHADFTIIDYCIGMRARRKSAIKNRKQIAFVLPRKAGNILDHRDPPNGQPSQAEPALGELPGDPSLGELWRSFTKTRERLLEDSPLSVLQFDAEYSVRDKRNKWFTEELAESAGRNNRGSAGLEVTSMPDCWIWLSMEALGFRASEQLCGTDEAIRRFVSLAVDVNHPGRRSSFDNHIRDDKARVITVSRARFNPRYRGRIVVGSRLLKELILHAALCLAAAAADQFPLPDSLLLADATTTAERGAL